MNEAEIPLLHPETVIGRGDDCSVRLSDPMVSRRHARISLERGVLRIEDLGSCHGTLVNQRLVERPTVLFAGDQIVIGSCAMDIVCRSSATPGPSESSGFGIVARSGVRLVEEATEPLAAEREPFRSPPSVSEYLVGPQQAIFPQGMLDTVAATLSSHVEHITSAVGRDQAVPDTVVDTAGWYCVKMAHVTGQSRWLATAVALHLLTSHVMREETLCEAIELTERGIRCDPALVRDYIRKLEEAPSSGRGGTNTRRALLERLAALALLPL
ncbi:MAG TPA: FHA domain-containing protein [Polyangiaceae bacterium]|nr:FHA domain-containing protein [Polyangiaceae bacterium]